MNSIFLISGTITFSHSIRKKMKHRYQSFTRIGRQLQSLGRQVYADWTSVSFPFCQRGRLIWRIMTNTMTNTYVVIFFGFNFWLRLSFQISEFRVHCTCLAPQGENIDRFIAWFVYILLPGKFLCIHHCDSTIQVTITK